MPMPNNAPLQAELAQLGREFVAWINVNAAQVENSENGPNERQINELANFGVRLISIIKRVS